MCASVRGSFHPDSWRRQSDTTLLWSKMCLCTDTMHGVQDVSGSFCPGVLTALVGESGAGKTTLMVRFPALSVLPFKMPAWPLCYRACCVATVPPNLLHTSVRWRSLQH